MKKLWIILLFVILAGGGYFAYTKWMKPSKDTVAVKDSDIEYYQCGMHPWIHSDEPGNCPICGMKLTPVYKTASNGGSASQNGIITIDPAMVQNIGVKTEAVRKRNLTHTIRTSGIVDYDETGQTYITTKFSGYIEKLFVDYTGKPVQKGQPLFEIYSPELVAAQQEYLQALRYRKSMSNAGEAALSADELLQSAKRKLQLWDISAQQLDQLAQTGEVRRTLTFYSPFTGVVIEKNVFDGMQVQAGQNLLKLAEISQMWVFADVYENELSFVKTGVPATIDLPYDAGKTLTGKVSYIYPYLQDRSRTARVRIDIPDPHGLLKKDMYVTVKIQPSVSIETLAVPEQAVIHSGTRDIVVLSLGEGKFKSAEVQLGALADGYYEVKEGLQEGDLIVTSSQFLIDSESNLQAGMSGMHMHTDSEKK